MAIRTAAVDTLKSSEQQNVPMSSRLKVEQMLSEDGQRVHACIFGIEEVDG